MINIKYWHFYAGVITLAILTQLNYNNVVWADSSSHNTSQQKTNCPKITTTIQNSEKRPTWKYKRDPKEFKVNKLHTLPSLPDMPAYQGKGINYMWGEEFPNARCGKAVTYNFNTTDGASKVRQWYEWMLDSNGWKLQTSPAASDKAASQQVTLSATKGTNSCSIMAMPGIKGQMNVRNFYRAVNLSEDITSGATSGTK